MQLLPLVSANERLHDVLGGWDQREGSVLVLSVEPIKQKSGRRWPIRAGSVWEMTQRVFHKDFPATDRLLRLDDEHYVLLQARETGTPAQGRAVNLLRHVTEFFLGSSTLEDVRVAKVVGMDDSGVLCHFLSASEVEAAASAYRPRAAGESAPASNVPAPPPVAPQASSQAARSYVTQPIWAVQKHAIVSHRLIPLCMNPLEPGGRTSIREAVIEDLGALDEALTLLASPEHAGFGLQVPLQFRTLNSTTGRQAVCARLQRAGLKAHRRVIACIEGVDAGVPRSVLETAVTALRPVCLGVLARAPGLATQVQRWRGARLSGVVLDMGDLQPSDHGDLPDLLQRFARDALAVGPGLILQSAATRAQAVAAWGAGFTHVAGDIVDTPANRPLAAIRFGPHDLYSTVGH